LKLQSCPNKKAVCGDRIIEVDKSKPGTQVTTVNMTNKDSCHWMVKAKCGVPKMKINKMGSDWINSSRLSWVEYQNGVADVKFDTTKSAYPAPTTVFEDLSALKD